MADDDKLNIFLEIIKRGDIDEVTEHAKDLVNPHTNTTLTQKDFIDAACLPNNCDILRYLIEETDILHYLKIPFSTEKEIEDWKIMTFNNAIKTNNEDEAGQKANVLYDFWCNRIHWTSISHKTDNNVLNKIESTGRALEKARNNNTAYFDDYPLLEIKIHCLIKFNEFQHSLYSELLKLTNVQPPSEQTDFVKAVLRTVIEAYNKYANLDKVRIPYECPKKEENHHRKDKLLIDDGFFYLHYELYYVKINNNVSMLILDNLDYLKKNLGNFDVYDQLECAVYKFIYRNNENWRLYLPKQSKMKYKTKLYSERRGDYEKDISLDLDRILYGSILLLEERSFKESLNEFSKNIENDPNTNKINFKKKHFLYNMTYMRDDYALKKIIDILEFVVYNVTEINGIYENEIENVIMINEAIKTVGEMSKSTDETLKISKTTQALIRHELSHKVLKTINDIRDKLSHTLEMDAKKMYESNKSVYQRVLTDLKLLCNSLKIVKNIFQPTLDKSIMKDGLKKIKHELLKITENDIKKYVRDNYNVSEHNKCLEEFKVKFPTTDEHVIQNIMWLNLTEKTFEKRKSEIEDHIQKNVKNVIVKYFKSQKDMLKEWQRLQKDDKIKSLKTSLLTPYPDYGKIETVKNNKKVRCDSRTIQKLTDIQNEADIEVFRGLRNFCIKEIDEFNHLNLSVENQKENYLLNVDEHEFLGKILEKNNLSNNSIEQKPQFNGILKLFKLLPKKSKDISFDLKLLKNKIDFLNGKLAVCDEKKNIMRYKQDLKFNIIIKSVLTDIHNILQEYHKKVPKLSEYLFTKSNFYYGTNLRNLLIHGNPLLEIIGNVLDDEDFASEVISNAMKIIKDETYVINCINVVLRPNLV